MKCCNKKAAINNCEKEEEMSEKIYLETRLYNVNDRMSSLELSEYIDRWAAEGLLGDMKPCFLPYRDSNNELEEGELETFGDQAIFDSDMRALKSCTGIAGYFDGIHYDSGCAFEVGCGFAWGYPVNLISTDFHKWAVGDGSEFYVGSRLLEYMATITYIADSNSSITDYRKQQEEFKQRVFQDFKDKMIKQYSGNRAKRKPMKSLEIKYDYYIDANFKYTEAGRLLLERIISILENNGKTYIIGDNQKAPEAELLRIQESGRPIFYDDYFEFNVDSGLLHGFAYGIGKKPIVYSSNVQRSISGGDPQWLNVMIRFSADIAKSLKDLENLTK